MALLAVGIVFYNNCSIRAFAFKTNGSVFKIIYLVIFVSAA